jgi:hypothetical protein
MRKFNLKKKIPEVGGFFCLFVEAEISFKVTSEKRPKRLNAAEK